MSDVKRPCKVRSDVGTAKKMGRGVPFFLLVSILFLYNFYSSSLLITFSNYSVSVPLTRLRHNAAVPVIDITPQPAAIGPFIRCSVFSQTGLSSCRDTEMCCRSL